MRSGVTKPYQGWETEPAEPGEETCGGERERSGDHRAPGVGLKAAVVGLPPEQLQGDARQEPRGAVPSVADTWPAMNSHIFPGEIPPIFYARIISHQPQPPQTFQKSEMYCNNQKLIRFNQ